MACIFCGVDRKISREHLWPDWARKLLESDSQTSAPLVPHVIAGSDGHFRQWEAPVFSATLKEVCRVCNNGWMSDVEELTKDLVVPMLRDEEVRLGKEEQLCVAIWGYMKVLTLERVRAPTWVLPVASYRGLRDHLANGVASLPRSATVFVATHGGKALDGGYTHHLIVDSADLGRPFFMGTFTLRQVVVQVFENLDGPSGIAPRRLAGLEGRDAQVWPVEKSTLDWPPGEALGDEELALYAGLAGLAEDGDDRP
ncbi:MAG TPA: hypothetical protein VHS74_00895 [Solirubrobacterales bacterium]|jgi:hypothetical protein|nr:hypothetical protein [Solirubrobacterales bacterium]